jgi:hypothetical protein
VTAPLDSSSSDNLPLVFCTGYRIEYKQAGRAIPLPGKSRPPFAEDGTAVCYKGLIAMFIKHDVEADGTISNFISPDANLDTTHYVQLTPDGPLSP